MADREKVIKELSWLIYNFPFQKNPKDEADRMCNAINMYCNDALALLKEQEPRVMTLEELKSIKTWNRNTPPYLWVEDITGRDNRWKYWRAIRESLNLPGTMGVQNYGSVWRVWNLRPTPEQMRDTKWEVADNA